MLVQQKEDIFLDKSSVDKLILQSYITEVHLFTPGLLIYLICILLYLRIHMGDHRNLQHFS